MRGGILGWHAQREAAEASFDIGYLQTGRRNCRLGFKINFHRLFIERRCPALLCFFEKKKNYISLSFAIASLLTPLIEAAVADKLARFLQKSSQTNL